MAYYGFASGLGPWTSVDLSADASGGGWTQGDGATGGQFPLPAPQTSSAANGYAVFDADAQCGGSQNARLVSPVLDLSAYDEVEVRWQQLYRRFANAIYLEVSVDGGATFGSRELAGALADNAYLGGADGQADVTSLDLTSVAAGESEVVIAFRYYSEPAVFGEDAGCGYAWAIDDVAVASAVAPRPVRALAFARVAAPPNFATPTGRGGEIPLYAEVENSGAAEQSVTVEVTITPRGGTEVLYEASSAAFAVAAGETAAAPEFAAYTLPEAPGLYTATYAIAGGGEAATVDFAVTDSAYVKTPGVTGYARPRGNASYSIGTVFELGDAPARLDSVAFAVEVTGDVATATTTLTLNTYGFVGDLDGDGALSLGSELVELSSRGVRVGNLLQGGDPLLRVSPTQSGEALIIDEAYDAIAVLITAPRTDSAAATRVSVGVYGGGGVYDYDLIGELAGADSVQVISRTDGGALVTSGFGGGLVPGVAVVVGEARSVGTWDSRPELPVVVYPNPASDYVTLDLGDAAGDDGSLRIVDARGRTWVAETVSARTERVDVSALPAGIYAVILEGDGRRGATGLSVH